MNKKIFLLITVLFSACFFACPLFAQTSGKVSHSQIYYQISGVPQTQEDNILQRLTVIRDSYPKDIDHDVMELFVQAAKKETELALQPYGYFFPEIKVTNSSNMNSWTITINIDHGKPLKIDRSEVTITGAGKDNQAIKQAVANTAIQAGDTFTVPNYNSAKKNIFLAARNNGYMKIQLIKHETQISLTTNEAVIFLTFDTGPRYYFGPVTFAQTPYSTTFLKRFINFNEGTPYSPQKVEQLQTDLMGSKYFNNVLMQPNINKATNEQVPLEIKTEPVKSQQYNLGLGYGTNTGARTSIGMDFYRLTDTGQHLSTLINWSEVSTGVSAKYYFPGEHPSRDQYTIGGSISEFNPDNGKAYPRSVSSGYDTAFGDAWHSSANMNFLNERYSVDDSPYVTNNYVYPSLYISRMTADNAITPSRANRITLSTQAGGPLSETEFAQAQLSGKWIIPLGKNNSLITGGSFGATYADNFEEDFPLSLRYFAGGIGSIRGYSYQSIGPGKYLKLASVQINQRISGNFFIGLFVDEGTASDNINAPLERGTGIAFIWQTPIGPVSVDIAQASTTDGKPLSLEFSLGAAI